MCCRQTLDADNLLLINRFTSHSPSRARNNPATLDNYRELASIKLMDACKTDIIKHREISFRGPHAEVHQAQTATLILSDVEGILQVQPRNESSLLISYDLSYINLQIIETLLSELGLHLDNSLFIKLRRALYYYTEDLQQETIGCKRDSGNCTQAVFINRYRQIEHGCRDVRPEHWRQYL